MSRKCFVLMPFADSFDGIWHHVLKRTIESIGDSCTRADDFFRPGNILSDVLKSIHTADYLIADLTSRNPNVFYELGVAHAVNKPVILISQDRDAVPFDVRAERIIFYQDNAMGISELSNSLIRAVGSIP